MCIVQRYWLVPPPACPHSFPAKVRSSRPAAGTVYHDGVGARGSLMFLHLPLHGLATFRTLTLSTFCLPVHASKRLAAFPAPIAVRGLLCSSTDYLPPEHTSSLST